MSKVRSLTGLYLNIPKTKNDEIKKEDSSKKEEDCDFFEFPLLVNSNEVVIFPT